MTESYKIEISPIDIEPYRAGNTGIPFVTTFDSGIDGPHVMVMAITHGNELCGAITVDWLFKQQVRPKRGKLTLGFSNWRAYKKFDTQNPLYLKAKVTIYKNEPNLDLEWVISSDRNNLCYSNRHFYRDIHWINTRYSCKYDMCYSTIINCYTYLS